MGARLDCPFCGTTAAEGTGIAPGSCPGCGARFAGGGDDPPGGVALAIAHWGLSGHRAARVADGLFRLLPDDPLARRVAVTSDRRDGFYRWWVFVAEAEDSGAALAAAELHAVV